MFDPPVIAVVEDDGAMREALCDLLQVLGLSCRAFDRAEAFLAAYEPQAFDCLISDVQLPGLSGLELLQQLKGMDATIPVIIITSHTEGELKARAMARGAYCFLTKPLANEALLECLKSALHRGDGWPV